VFWVEYITEDQRKVLGEFRGMLQTMGVLGQAGAGASDTDLCRFLQARKWELPRAAEMYQKQVRWRADNGVDSLLGSFVFPQFEMMAQMYPMFYAGTDRFGRPIYVERLGMVNMTEIMKHCDEDAFLKFHIWGWEYLIKHRFPAASKRAGREIYSSCTIIDLEGASLMQFPQVQSLLKLISSIDQDNYPEHLGNMFILNSGYTFSAVWSVIKPWLDERTQDKIKLCTAKADDQVWPIIDPETFPEASLGPRPAPCPAARPLPRGTPVARPSPGARTRTPPPPRDRSSWGVGRRSQWRSAWRGTRGHGATWRCFGRCTPRVRGSGRGTSASPWPSPTSPGPRPPPRSRRAFPP